MLTDLFLITLVVLLKCRNFQRKFVKELISWMQSETLLQLLVKDLQLPQQHLTALALVWRFYDNGSLEHYRCVKGKSYGWSLHRRYASICILGLAMGAVGRAAMSMIEEVRRQFTTIPALKAALDLMRKHGDKPVEEWSKEDQKVFHDADGKAEYGKCVEISTKAAIREMVLPGIMAVVAPVVIAFLPGFGVEALGGMLAGVTVTGVLMAIFQSNAGGAWDNAKKSFEEGVEINGKMYYKKSEPHKAAVVGDTVGDPFKDTSGPSLNILLKLMSVVALVIAPLLGA